ncbi:uncharacterized protein K460DRAFT_340538 [Cucurbitaria berberidis CBS 394.84]|uniref:Zn(2)-C6 fungal-type domain-containing protein n=1 Tax=Cucurbitaria berberidis CBS 394.84 TaxID=1168544 RepID=A0A9P4GBR7_9PLEO|nr:uncharacterized protein K460DRAFT_340538 [Cucurbitaria berberidis CBS 394.84]KAF1842938.1 hypothetical protein K460DRAFT_340538 [Cucurbitaria berberidis CBS 394.84]
MPRPKVHPNLRQRAAEACSFCRASKKRCSATVPCAACLKRGIAESCRLSKSSKSPRVSLPGPGPSTAPRLVEEDHSAEPTTPNIIPSGHNRPSSPPSSPNNAVLVPQSNDTSSVQVSSFETESQTRMLLNRSGNRMFIGEAASISFLQLVRDTVSANLGPSQFSHNDKVDRMLEAQPLSLGTSCPSPDFFSEEASSYFDVYCSSTTGLIDILSTTESTQFCRIDGETCPGALSTNSTIRDLVIAIGAQCQSLASSQNAGERYFRRAQLAAFSTMLEDPSIDMVRTFLLMSFYMLGQCRRNKAFMYLGIATRAATSTGLHNSGSYSGTCNLETHLRAQVWMSLCNVDILVSSILGRPPATGGLRLDVEKDPIDVVEVAEVESTSVKVSFEILTIINEIVHRIYVKKDKSITTAEQLLGRVETWSRKLPKSLSNHHNSLEDPNRKESLAEMHVSCLYYYAITLITRPVLVSALTSGLGSDGSQLASACLDAAILLVQTCVNVYRKKLMIGNMCFIKALIFASGLIIGFAIFVEQKGDDELDAAFHGAQSILSFLSTQSPQAAHYMDILSLLSRAITSKRQKQTQRGRNKYVEKLFAHSQEISAAVSMAHDDNLVLPINGSRITTENSAIPFLGSEMLPSTFEDVSIELPFDWDILEISQWDSFPFLDQSDLQFE